MTLDLVLTNHLNDTKTKRYYFDQAFLSVLPGASGYKLTWSGGGTPQRQGLEADRDLHAARARPRRAAVQRQDRRRTGCVFDLVDAGGAATRDVRVGVVARLVPGLGVRHGLDAGQHASGSSSRPATRSRSRRARSRTRPRTDVEGRIVFQTGKLDKPLSFFAYLVGDRPGALRRPGR